MSCRPVWLAGELTATYSIKSANASDRDRWNEYVSKHPQAGIFHLFGWRDVIHRAYGHDAYYLIAERAATHAAVPAGDVSGVTAAEAVGVLPLVHMKRALSGNCLVSMPFVDGGGVLAESSDVEEGLLSEAVSLGRRIGAKRIELRSDTAVGSWDGAVTTSGAGHIGPLTIAKRSDKVRMLLRLPETSEELPKSFRSKLRSQINRPIKDGCTSRTGGLEMLGDFYQVFLINMRELGSPVHSKDLLRHVLSEFPERSKIVVVYHAGIPVASSLVLGFNQILRNPWASSDRRYATMSPNMLLYLRMLEFACDNGYRTFDFGRSIRGEGTYRFKEQWGAVAAPLHWYVVSLDGRPLVSGATEVERFGMAARCWKWLPLAVTRVLGPRIRKHISL